MLKDIADGVVELLRASGELHLLESTFELGLTGDQLHALRSCPDVAPGPWTQTTIATIPDLPDCSCVAEGLPDLAGFPDLWVHACRLRGAWRSAHRRPAEIARAPHHLHQVITQLERTLEALRTSTTDLPRTLDLVESGLTHTLEQARARRVQPEHHRDVLAAVVASLADRPERSPLSILPRPLSLADLDAPQPRRAVVLTGHTSGNPLFAAVLEIYRVGAPSLHSDCRTEFLVAPAALEDYLRLGSSMVLTASATLEDTDTPAVVETAFGLWSPARSSALFDLRTALASAREL